MSYPPIKLPDDPREALRKIAGYLETARTDRFRAMTDRGELMGYWQTVDWLIGLKELSSECQRVAMEHDKGIQDGNES